MTAKPAPELPEPSEITRTSLTVATRKNQLTLSEGIFANFLGADYFEVTTEEGRMVLTPVEPAPIEAVWTQIEALGITEDEFADAVQWERGRWMW